MNFYDLFHSNTTTQTKIINSKNFTYRFLVETLNKYAFKNKKILDIGCGSGTIDFYLAENGSQVLGIDISEKAIEKCKESSRILKLERNAKFEVINFPKDSVNQKFDMIICAEVLEHLKKDRLALEKIKNMLKPKGIVIISVPSVNAPLYKWGLASNFDKQVGHLRRYSVDKLSSMLLDIDLELLETKKIEGLLRNFLFLNRNAGKLIRFLRNYMSDIVTIVDKALIPLLGESNIIIVAKNKKL